MVAQIDGTYVRTRPSRLWSRLISYGLFEGRPLTTRGQWINPLLFRLFSMQRRMPQLKKVESPVFILGTGRSGTTILGIVLSMHRDVGFLNEPKAIWAALRDDEDLIGSYHRDEARYRLEADDASPALVREAHRIYGAYLRMSGNNRVVDKYPEMIFRVPFLRKIFPDARFLFLSRNGWDTCASIESWSGRLGTEVNGEQHDWWGVNGRKWRLLIEQVVPEHDDLAPHQKFLCDLEDHRLRAAVEWIVTMREGMKLEKTYPNEVMHVPYEGLCQNPQEIAANIAHFAGLADDVRYLQYANEVLSPPPARRSFDLPPCLVDPFHATQRELGYDVEGRV